MAFIVKQKVHGKDYYYLRKSVREGDKVRSIGMGYLGKTKKGAEKRAKEILNKGEGAKTERVEKPVSVSEWTEIAIEDLAGFCKRKGFVYPSGEIYGGFAGFWDYGHLGVELKNNIKKEWWKAHVIQREDIVGIDGSIITHPKTWKASGHIDSFSDIFVVCKKCKKPNKIDKNELGKVKCECGGEYDESKAKEFKLMFKTNVGEGGGAYLRPETAQLIFTNFKAVYDNARGKLPFGIAQIGKAFRNEIAPRDFIFRVRELEQMEIEYFIKKGQKCEYKISNEKILVYSSEAQEKKEEPIVMSFKEALKKGIIKRDWHAYWLGKEVSWFTSLGANPKRFRIRQHTSDELAHYSSDCWDLEYRFPFGWKELQGIADRGDFDLSKHEEFSKKDLNVLDVETNQKVLPEVVAEPSLGVERSMLVFMFDAYFENKERSNVVLKINPKLSPVKAAVFPIIKKPEFEEMAREIVEDLRGEWNIAYDKSGSIGRRYVRNDEIGTPFCITIDEKSFVKKDVTVRDRDTTKQVRIKMSKLKEALREAINGGDIFKFGKLIDTRIKK